VPTFKQFKLPDVGEGLTEAEILKWYVKPGDTVTVNQTIVEIETAKAAVELPSPFSGTVTELLVEEGATVDVGEPIISVDVDADGQQPPEVQPQPAAEAPATAPALRDDMAPEVPRPAGDEPVEPGIIGGPAPGGRTSVLVGYGPRSVVAKRRPRKTAGPAGNGAVRDEATATLSPAGRVTVEPADGGADAPARQAAAAIEEWPATATRAGGPADVSVLAKPPVRKLAKDLGVDLTRVAGSGPDGVVTRSDVEAAAKATPGARAAADLAAVPEPEEPRPVAAGTAPIWDASREQRIPIKGVRKHTAAAMVASAFTAPHVTEWMSVDVTPTMELRKRVAELPDYAGLKVSPLVFVARALLLAVRRHPLINSSWDEEAQEIVVREYVNLGIAAATPRGLVVPNIKDAGRLSLRELAVALGELTETARAGRTTPADMAGGTITITNVGVFGVDGGTPILNPGETAILATGAVRETPWVVDGQLAVRQVMQLALSFDHRIVDGQLGSEFLADVAGMLADPGLALAWS